MKEIKINQFLDDYGKIVQLPTKEKSCVEVLRYLSEKFAKDKTYSEQEVNAICATWNTFGDYFILRRKLVDYSLLNREMDGSKYWRVN